MKLLVLGSGAREHALVARLAAEAGAPNVICAPGNPGVSRLVRVVPLDLNDIHAALTLADREDADLTIVGPELPLSLGVVDQFVTAGRRIFGPSAAAARLETSKAFAKAF